MRIAVHKNTGDLFDDKWIEYLQQYGCEVLVVDLKSYNAIEQISACDGVMWHYHHDPVDKQIAPIILATIEQELKIPVWPNYATRWHFDEKCAQHFMLEALDVPHIKSWVFWNKEDSINFIKSAKYPLVFKLSVGAGSSNVIKVDDYAKAYSLVTDMFNYGIFPYKLDNPKRKPTIIARFMVDYLINKKIRLPAYYRVQKDYVYFQEFIPNNDYDIRITVIGKRAFGFVRFNRTNDFRASGSGKIDYSLDKIPLEAVKIAMDFSERNGFQSMAYDFLVNPQGYPVINEISYGYADSAVYNCTGHWDENLEWHKGHMWPEEAHVLDFINEIEDRAYTLGKD